MTVTFLPPGISNKGRRSDGRWKPGVCGNPRGRPTNEMLAAKIKVGKYFINYAPMTGDELVAMGRLVFGQWWMPEVAAGLGVSRQSVIRWCKNTHALSYERELQLLALCLARVRTAHEVVRRRYRLAAAASRVRRADAC